MRRSRSFWLLSLLSASCAVKGFTIADELPGDNGGSGGSGATGNQSGSGASQSQGGDGVAGTMDQGGKVGTAGSQNEAGMPMLDGGEPSVGGGGDGAGGAPSSGTAPCDPVGDTPPLLCDDFESGTLMASSWMPGPGMEVIGDEGPHGATKLVRLNGAALGTKLPNLPISEASPITVSFWLKAMKDDPGQPIVTFRDASATQSTLFVSNVEKELGFRNASANFFVPQTPSGNVFTPGSWVCVSLTLRPSSLQLRYQTKGSISVSTLVADSEPTPGIDTNWNNLPSDSRSVLGYPAFAGAVNGIGSDILIDDVRIVAGTTNICDL